MFLIENLCIHCLEWDHPVDSSRSPMDKFCVKRVQSVKYFYDSKIKIMYESFSGSFPICFLYQKIMKISPSIIVFY